MRDTRENNAEYYQSIFAKYKNLNSSPSVSGKQKRRVDETKNTSSSLLLSLLVNNKPNSQSCRKDVQSKSLSPKRPKGSTQSLAFKSDSKFLNSSKQVNAFYYKDKCNFKDEKEEGHALKCLNHINNLSNDKVIPRTVVKKNRYKLSEKENMIYVDQPISFKISMANSILKRVIKSKSIQRSNESNCQPNDELKQIVYEQYNQNIDGNSNKPPETPIKFKNLASKLVCWCLP